MNKMTTKKLVATFAVAALFIGGAIAQTVVPGYTDGAGTGTNYVNTATQATTEVTVGKAIPFYADPDTYFHPSYNPEDGSGITAGFSWTWYTSAADSANITIGATTDNYSEITGATVGGPYTLNVVENGPICSDGTPETIAITVLAQPTFSLSTTTNLELCLGDPGLPAAPLQSTITANGASDYHMVWNLEIYTMSGSPAAADEWFDTDLVTSLGGAQAYAEEFTTAAPDQTQTAAGTFNLTAMTPNGIIGSKSTVYVYTLTSINDLVSRRGDFLTIDDAIQGSGNAVNSTAWSDFAYYAVAGQTVTITVHPTPVTGPIFHINNTWAQ